MFLSDLLFPRCCLGCGKAGRYFCQNCLKTLKPISHQVCPICEKPSINGLTHFRCQTKSGLDGLTSIFAYEGIIKTAISKLKYKFVTDLTQDLVTLMNQFIEVQFKPLIRWLNKNGTVVLLPVPLFPRRERWRGFNQSEVLGVRLANDFSWEMRKDILVRAKYTQPQIGFKEDKRQENIRGAFKIFPQFAIEKLESLQLVLFDDVWTTGSTLKECGRVLKRAGAKKVWGLTVAR